MKGKCVYLPREGMKEIAQKCGTRSEMDLVILLASILNKNNEICITARKAADLLPYRVNTVQEAMDNLIEKGIIIKTNIEDKYVFGGEMATTHFNYEDIPPEMENIVRMILDKDRRSKDRYRHEKYKAEAEKRLKKIKPAERVNDNPVYDRTQMLAMFRHGCQFGQSRDLSWHHIAQILTIARDLSKELIKDRSQMMTEAEFSQTILDRWIENR